jgi:hypothetical protein
MTFSLVGFFPTCSTHWWGISHMAREKTHQCLKKAAFSLAFFIGFKNHNQLPVIREEDSKKGMRLALLLALVLGWLWIRFAFSLGLPVGFQWSVPC